MTAIPATASQRRADPLPSTPRPGRRSPGDDIRAVGAALTSDWIKVSTVRVHRALLLLTIAGGLLVSWAVGVLVTDQVQYVAQVGFFWTSVTSMLAAISGILLFGSEVQHGTLAGALAAQPARWVLALSKALTAAALGMVIGAAGLAAGFGGAVLAGLGAGDTSSLSASVAWALLFTTLSAVLGLGIAMVVRTSTAAIAGVLVWGFVVEHLFKLFLAEEAARFLPFIAGNHLLAYSSDFETPRTLAVALTPAANALVFGGYAAVALVLGTVLLYRRDTN
ncbi:ABC transporter permease subunit [Modestobacter lapidis]|nr:ABC transporter permease subunit [Modestobacter lapidis]